MILPIPPNDKPSERDSHNATLIDIRDIMQVMQSVNLGLFSIGMDWRAATANLY